MKNTVQWNKLREVQLRFTFNGCHIDMDIMNEAATRHELLEIVERIRRKTLFFMHLDVYEDSLCEFYSSLSMLMDEHKSIIGYTISFRMKEDDYEIELEKFVEWLNYDNEGILNTLWVGL